MGCNWSKSARSYNRYVSCCDFSLIPQFEQHPRRSVEHLGQLWFASQRAIWKRRLDDTLASGWTEWSFVQFHRVWLGRVCQIDSEAATWFERIVEVETVRKHHNFSRIFPVGSFQESHRSWRLNLYSSISIDAECLSSPLLWKIQVIPLLKETIDLSCRQQICEVVRNSISEKKQILELELQTLFARSYILQVILAADSTDCEWSKRSVLLSQA